MSPLLVSILLPLIGCATLASPAAAAPPAPAAPPVSAAPPSPAVPPAPAGNTASPMPARPQFPRPEALPSAQDQAEFHDLLHLLASKEWQSSAAREAVLTVAGMQRSAIDADLKPLLLSSLQDPKLSVRLKALDLLRDYKIPEALQPIENLLGDDNAIVRRQAVSALGRLGGPEAAHQIAALLADPDAEVRRTAVYTLAQMQQDVGIDTLLALMGQKDPQIRITALEFGGTANIKELPRLIKAGLADDAAPVRARALLLIEGKRPAEITLDDFQQLLNDKDDGVRAAAVMAVSSSTGAGKGALLDKASHDASNSVRESVAVAASGLPYEGALPILKTLSADPAAEVREAAVRQLDWPMARGHEAEIVPLLVAASKDTSASVALTAVQNLTRLHAPERTQAIADLYARADAPTRYRMMNLLSQLPEAQSKDLISAAIKDTDPMVRQGAVGSLRNLPFELGMSLAVQAAADSDASVRRGVIFFLIPHRNEPRAIDLLNKLAADPDRMTATAAQQAMQHPAPHNAPAP